MISTKVGKAFNKRNLRIHKKRYSYDFNEAFVFVIVLQPYAVVSFRFAKARYSALAQSVEHAAVNRSVVGSSPTSGAIPVIMA